MPPRRGSGPARALLLLGCLAVGCVSTTKDGLPLPSPVEEEPAEHTGWSKEGKLIAVNAALGSAVIVYGLHYWGYGGASFQWSDERWFQKNTENAGSDKLGHAYTGYLGTMGLAALYESFGYERSEADLYGALSSMGTMTLIEVADGTSHYGFSWQDLVADGMGVAYGYWRRRVPEIGRYVDYRVEYFPSATATGGHHSDFATDYSAYKYVVALKLDAFEQLRSTPLSWFELQAGYYTKGYGAGDADFFNDKSRHFYLAVGLNMSRIFSKLGLRKIGQFFEYYQAPYTYVPLDWSLPQ